MLTNLLRRLIPTPPSAVPITEFAPDIVRRQQSRVASRNRHLRTGQEVRPAATQADWEYVEFLWRDFHCGN